MKDDGTQGPVSEEDLEKVPSEEGSQQAFLKAMKIDEKIATAKAIQEIAMQTVLFLFVIVAAGALFWAAICFAGQIIKQHNELSGFFDAKVIFVLSALLLPPTLFLFALMRAIFPKNVLLNDSKESNSSATEERLMDSLERFSSGIKNSLESLAEKYIKNTDNK